MALPLFLGIPALLTLVTAFFTSMLTSFITWIADKAVQRFIVLALFLVVILALLNILYSVITGSISNFSGTAPVFSVFYDALMPANFATALSVFITVETALAVFKWKFKMARIKFTSR